MPYLITFAPIILSVMAGKWLSHQMAMRGLYGNLFNTGICIQLFIVFNALLLMMVEGHGYCALSITRWLVFALECTVLLYVFRKLYKLKHPYFTRLQKQPVVAEESSFFSKIALSRSAIIAPISILSLAIVSWMLLVMYWAPASGWDFLYRWANLASTFIQAESCGVNFGIEDSIGPSIRELNKEYRHPITNGVIAGWNAFLASDARYLQGVNVAWPLVYASGFMVVTGFIGLICQSGGLALVGGYGFLTLPLLQNHAMLSGYPDMLVSLLTVSAACLLAQAIYRRGYSTGYLVLTLLLSLAIWSLKNTAVIYLCAIWAPYFSYALVNNSYRKLFYVMLFFFPIGAALMAMSLDFHMWGMGLASIEGARTISFGGYQMLFEQTPTLKLLYNNFWALFVNQSHSLTAILWMVAAAIVMRSADNNSRSIAQVCAYLLTVYILLLMCFILPQFVSSYSERYAAYYSDLGNSRFLLALGPLALLAGCTGVCLVGLQKQRQAES